MVREGDTALNFAALQLCAADMVGGTPLNVLGGVGGDTAALKFCYEF